MFGIDFLELLVILVIALIVIGPERLPAVARTCGHLLGRAQRYIKGVKAGISRDMAVEEIRQFRQDMRHETNNAEQAIMHAKQAIDQQMLQLNSIVPQTDKATTQTIPK